MEIRNSKLYRQAGHATFEDYCSKRWKLSRVVAYRTMAAHETIINLPPIGYKMPDNEAQTRALSGLEPEEQRAVWKQAVETAPDGKITARRGRLRRRTLRFLTGGILRSFKALSTR